MGAVLRLPFATVSPWPGALAGVAGAGFELVALTPRHDAEPVAAFTPSGAVALLVGSEAHGLSEEALAAAGRHVRIPMRSGIDSLNVAAAAAIAFHHVFRP
jgi:tRNA G18 (ribose-2'-O)-methylase SpoU